LLRQARHDLVKLVPVLRKAVQQDDGGTGSTADVVKRSAVHLSGIGDKTLPKFRHSRINLTLRFCLAKHAAARDQNTKKRPQDMKLHMHTLLILSSVGDSTTPVSSVSKAKQHNARGDRRMRRSALSAPGWLFHSNSVRSRSGATRAGGPR
jgi:predicted GIY-YIG superfamily endonuclease